MTYVHMLHALSRTGQRPESQRRGSENASIYCLQAKHSCHFEFPASALRCLIGMSPAPSVGEYACLLIYGHWMSVRHCGAEIARLQKGEPDDRP